MQRFGKMDRMPTRTAIAFAACLLTCIAWAQNPSASPLGTWRTFDDDTHAPKALVEITAHDGELRGRIVKLFRAPGDDPNPLCNKCTDERHNQPVLGMTILSGMHQHGDEWDGGEILDPEEGKLYRSKLHVSSDGKLELRGYIGIALLGRTQVWERATP
jgi:uncharacterized protein (DUF2147 family)